MRNGLISGVPLTVQNTISAIYEEIEMLDAKITKFEKRHRGPIAAGR